MKLITNWRKEINRLWTIKAAIGAALLGIADQVLASFQAALPPVLYSLIFVAIIVLRVSQQKDPR